MTPSLGFAFEIQADQSRPGRHAANEGAGAVDRIEDPGEAGIAVFGSVFLAENAMIGIALLDQLAHHPLGAFVGLGNRVPDRPSLDLHGHVLAEMR